MYSVQLHQFTVRTPPAFGQFSLVSTVQCPSLFSGKIRQNLLAIGFSKAVLRIRIRDPE